MGNVKKLNELVTITNTNFFDFKYSHKVLVDNSIFENKDISYEDKMISINSFCKKLNDDGYGSCYLGVNDDFICIAFDNYKKFRRKTDEPLIYKLENFRKDYSISTGVYCGVINFSKYNTTLSIKTDLSDSFFKRILNYCCGIYADVNVSKKTEENKSIYSLLVQYLFIMSLRKVANKFIPKQYRSVFDRGYNLHGNIDINSYVNYDLLTFDKKITFSFQKRIEIQQIIDVLYVALKICKISKNKEDLPEINKFKIFLCENYSGVRPSRTVINNISKSKCLYNGLYSEFKKPLEYAKILINGDDLNNGNEKSLNGISGFLVDSSFLWEMYLYNLMRINLPDWEIESQCVISFYSNTFFSKTNYPDFVLRNKYNNKIFVLDAKFKKMNFRNIDVDNDDIRQLHAYSYYYLLKEKDNFKGAGLIYPSKYKKPNDLNNIDNIYGFENSTAKFGVFNIVDPGIDGNVIDSENEFINDLKIFLNS